MGTHSILDLLKQRAESSSDKALYTFLDADGNRETISAKGLQTEALSVAAFLCEKGLTGERALIICNPGLEDIICFFACLYAGVIAVPVPPPSRRSVDNRLQAIAHDSGAAIAMGAWDNQIKHLPHFQGRHLPNIRLAEISKYGGVPKKCDLIHPESVAFLQYTSGSTAAPKGVVVSHANIFSNARHIHEKFGLRPDDRAVFWLPLYHDMGLLGGIVQPLYSQFETTLLAPATFMQRPLVWLESIEKEKATISGAPNFAYELCGRSALLSPDRPLDLSSWRIAFSGAERVRFGTLKRFAETYKTSGFRFNSFRPCYGLAEATLLVSCVSDDMRTLTADVDALGEGRFAPPESAQTHAIEFVESGTAHGDCEVLIVEPNTNQICPEDIVGEIWTAGPNIARGYWNRPDAAQFVVWEDAYGSKPVQYLRTGDLGFFHDGHLFVTGRLKDLLIVRGRNYYPEDLELTASQSSNLFRSNATVAFSIDMDGDERVIVVQEVDRRTDVAKYDEAIKSLRADVLEAHELLLHTVVLVRHGSLPQTSSGKIRRTTCKDAYLRGDLKILGVNDGVSSHSAPLLLSSELEQIRNLEDLEHLLNRKISACLGTATPLLNREIPINTLGLDSLLATELKLTIERFTGKSVAMSAILGGASLADLMRLAGKLHGEAPDREPLDARSVDPVWPRRLSAGQEALWFLQQLRPDDSSLNISRLLKISGPLNIEATVAAFQLLVVLHPSLRAQFFSEDGIPAQRMRRSEDFLLKKEDVRGWTNEELALQVKNEASRPFDLNSEPLLRLNLYQLGDSEFWLLFVVHHIVVDLLSLLKLIEQFKVIYEEIRFERKPALEVDNGYRQFVDWQLSMLGSDVGSQLEAYWTKHLLPLPEPLALSLPLKKDSDFRAETVRLQLDEGTISRLKAIARMNATTLQTVLIACYQILLCRYSGQTEFLMGVLWSGRNGSRWQDTIGYFVNPLVLRCLINPDARFEQHLRSCGQELLSAMDNGDYPFARLVERFRTIRQGGEIPLIQTICVMQPDDSRHFYESAALIMDDDGPAFSMGGIRFDCVKLNTAGVQFDLTLVAAESRGKVEVCFYYNAGHFEPYAIEQMARAFRFIAEGISRFPQGALNLIPITDQQELQHCVGPAADLGRLQESSLIHKMFERQAERTPQKIAVRFRSRDLSFDELNSRANALANDLLHVGVKAESRVGVYLDRTEDMPIAILGVLKSGGVYVPMDIDYPSDRIHALIHSSGMSAVITNRRHASKLSSAKIIDYIYLESTEGLSFENCGKLPAVNLQLDNLAYVIYTSGSTGLPKGVMVSHRNLINFCLGMDRSLGCAEDDTLLAVTNTSFDISLLEILWTLSRGCCVVLADSMSASSVARSRRPAESLARLTFSLFYFASSDSLETFDRYRLLLEGGKLADSLGLEAIWTPERHFHEFGGLYPNPSLTSAALATVTKQISLRAGSVVLPLHNPIRVAEEWAVIDVLSNGRVGVAFASGWHPDDFVLAPDAYEHRREKLSEQVSVVQALWKGDVLQMKNGRGEPAAVRTYPKPVQKELPIWLTSGGNVETFIAAGKLGANVLTHLLGQSVAELAALIQAYRRQMRESHPGISGKVTLMLHTYLDESEERVRQKSLDPFKRYLNSSVDLIGRLLRQQNLDIDIEKLSEQDSTHLLDFAASRYFGSSGLFGTEEVCLEKLEPLANAGIDEIACLVDFGVDTDSVLRSIEKIGRLQRRVKEMPDSVEDYTLGAVAARHKVTLMQCTPSLWRLMEDDQKLRDSLSSMRLVMLGGEPVPPAAVKQLKQYGVGKVFNMYGPTETTIWSAAEEALLEGEAQIVIRGPVLNTQIYILDKSLTLVPHGVVGELYISGDGVARGYLGDPKLTADRFIPNPWALYQGERMYRTGDVGRALPGGKISLLGRSDQQIKLRGHRIELGEIEAVIKSSGLAREAISFLVDDDRLAVCAIPDTPTRNVSNVLEFCRAKLPSYMIPTEIRFVERLPLTSNGKVDRKKIRDEWRMVPAIDPGTADDTRQLQEDSLEVQISEIWKEVLRVERVSIRDNFFEVGGHSLLMVQIHQKLQRMLSREFPLLTLFENPTIERLVSHLEGTRESSFPEPSEERAKKQRSAMSEFQRRMSESRNQAPLGLRG